MTLKCHIPAFRGLMFLAISTFLPTHDGLAQSPAPAKGPEPKTKAEAAPAPKRVKIPREALSAIAGFELAPGIKASLFAAEPMVVNPVALAVDEIGGVYVCETFRQELGVEDNRGHEDWIDDDLASQSVDDRLAMYKKHYGEKVDEEFGSREDRIRLLLDRNGDGLADRATVFINGFDDPVEGTGAGILVRKSNVFYTCIPRLWAFRDDDGDGKADRQVTLHDGFGVRVAFRGHDLHALTLGNDGRVYFSVGDRGYNVETEKRRLKDPESGAIFRCEQDGSHLEVVATGFRNPQELAFDDWGNLFTGENNSDSGDLARWVHVLEGMDAGWRMAFQYLPDRGPWNRERMWEPYWPGQPAFIFPPVANYGDGPSGVAYYPGTGLADAYQGNFFLCDFRGGSAQSGIRTFKVRPKGGSFELIDPELFLWKCLATDLAFAPDGTILVSDWVDGWEGTGKGRIYRLGDPKQLELDVVKELKNILGKGVSKLDEKELEALFEHPDQRARKEAQFELALRRDVETLLKVAKESKLQFARLHAIWGLGQIARRDESKTTQAARKALMPYLVDVDGEIRAAAAVMLGDCGHAAAARQMTNNLRDSNARVRVANAIALGKLKYRPAVRALMEVLDEEGGSDPAIRHACVMGLVGCATESQLVATTQSSSPQVRVAAVVALRRLGSDKVAEFLKDSDELVVAEAARAIYDVPISPGYEALSRLTESQWNSEAILRRAIAAHSRLGGADHAKSLAKFAANAKRVTHLRQFALNLLASWETPSSRDPVIGMWRPVQGKRQGSEAVDAIRENLQLLLQAGHEVRFRSTQIAAQFGLSEAGDALLKLLWESPDATEAERAGALLSLSSLENDTLRSNVDRALKDDAPRVRAAARVVLSRIDPFGAVTELEKGIRDGTPLERQSAIETLPIVGNEAGDNLLTALAQSLSDGKIPPYVQVDVLIAARRRAEKVPAIQEILKAYEAKFSPEDPVASYRVALEGGNAERGAKIFVERINLQCARCHMVGGQGGRVGPDLSKIGGDKTREYLLESIVHPDATIAQGFETQIIITDDGKTLSGIVQSEDEEMVHLMTAEGNTISVAKKSIEERTRGQSAMPADLVKQMTLFDLRYLIEYMTNLKP